jgi:hypothetical protein
MEQEDRIRMRAYDIWIAEGCPAGREKDHWEQAAAEIEATTTDASDNTGIPAAEAEPPTAEETSQTKPSLARRAA